jgi:hypothetical protein
MELNCTNINDRGDNVRRMNLLETLNLTSCAMKLSPMNMVG